MNNRTDAPPSLAAEITTLIDALIARMGLVEYCKWLANNTPVKWVIDAPYAEIAEGLRAKLAPARLTAPAQAGEGETARV